jgi:hypothetical protein
MTAKYYLRLCCLVVITLSSACTGVQFVSPYDEVIYSGITEYKADLNLHVKNMADLAGTPEGTYEANKLKYNSFETRLDMLIDRASAQSTGAKCSLSQKMAERLDRSLRDKKPAELQNVATNPSSESNSYGCTEKLLINVRTQLAFLEEIHGQTERCPLRRSESIRVIEIKTSDSGGDLDQVIDQAVDEVVEALKANLTNQLLARLEDMDIAIEAAIPEDNIEQMATVSCLSPAAAAAVINISDQSIDAVWVVENAKRQGVR